MVPDPVAPPRAGPLARMLSWAWLLVVAVVGAVGAIRGFRDPSRLEIAEFSRIYDGLGASDQVMIVVFLVLPLTTALAAGTIILVRRPSDPGALILVTGMVGLFLFVSGFPGLIEPEWLGRSTGSAALITWAVLLAGFPTGSFRPRWAVAAPAVVLAATVLRPDFAVGARAILSTPDTVEEPQVVFAGIVFGTALAVALAAQAVRYHRVSTVAERHQSRWVMFGTLVMILPVCLLLPLIVAERAPPALVGGAVAASALGSYVFQAAVLIAVFRYHLYDLDRLISRTVTYGFVALAVSGVYGLVVVVLPVALGESDDLVVAAATLASAGVFAPVRRRVQRLVDRRFNRDRYDADRELMRFAGRLNRQVDLDALATDLQRIAGRTLAPSHLALWIKDPTTDT